MNRPIRFDVHGRFVLEVVRQDGRWAVYRPGAGVRRRDEQVSIPPDLPASALADWLEDLLHEYARPGSRLRRLEDTRHDPSR